MMVKYTVLSPDRALASSAHEQIPTTYVYTELDRTIPVALQRAIFTARRDAGIAIDEVSLQAGHSPSLSVPDKLAEVVLQYA